MEVMHVILDNFENMEKYKDKNQITYNSITLSVYTFIHVYFESCIFCFVIF